MTHLQIFQWAIIIIIGSAGSVVGYYQLELFTKARIGWAIFCSIGWMLFTVTMAYVSMFPQMPDKHGHIFRYLVFADKFGREDIFQMAAYVVFIWSLGAMLINRYMRKRFSE